MPRYVIQRDIPGAGSLGDAEFSAIARRSNEVLRELGPSVQWIHSYVADDRIYCVYDAPDAESIAEHARRGGFPADVIAEVRRVIDPSTGAPIAGGAALASDGGAMR
jgi:hypothetical protein